MKRLHKIALSTWENLILASRSLSESLGGEIIASFPVN